MNEEENFSSEDSGSDSGREGYTGNEDKQYNIWNIGLIERYKRSGARMKEAGLYVGQIKRTVQKGIVLAAPNLGTYTQAHHIIPQSLREHEMWQMAGMDVNDACNIITLPTKKGKELFQTKGIICNRSVHQGYGLHDLVKMEMEAKMSRLTETAKKFNYTKDQCKAALRKIIANEYHDLKNGRRQLVKNESLVNKPIDNARASASSSSTKLPKDAPNILMHSNEGKAFDSANKQSSKSSATTFDEHPLDNTPKPVYGTGAFRNSYASSPAQPKPNFYKATVPPVQMPQHSRVTLVQQPANSRFKPQAVQAVAYHSKATNYNNSSNYAPKPVVRQNITPRPVISQNITPKPFAPQNVTPKLVVAQNIVPKSYNFPAPSFVPYKAQPASSQPNYSNRNQSYLNQIKQQSPRTFTPRYNAHMASAGRTNAVRAAAERTNAARAAAERTNSARVAAERTNAARVAAERANAARVTAERANAARVAAERANAARIAAERANAARIAAERANAARIAAERANAARIAAERANAARIAAERANAARVAAERANAVRVAAERANAARIAAERANAARIAAERANAARVAAERANASRSGRGGW